MPDLIPVSNPAIEDTLEIRVARGKGRRTVKVRVKKEKFEKQYGVVGRQKGEAIYARKAKIIEGEKVVRKAVRKETLKKKYTYVEEAPVGGGEYKKVKAYKKYEAEKTIAVTVEDDVFEQMGSPIDEVSAPPREKRYKRIVVTEEEKRHLYTAKRARKVGEVVTRKKGIAVVRMTQEEAERGMVEKEMVGATTREREAAEQKQQFGVQLVMRARAIIRRKDGSVEEAEGRGNSKIRDGPYTEYEHEESAYASLIANIASEYGAATDEVEVDNDDITKEWRRYIGRE